MTDILPLIGRVSGVVITLWVIWLAIGVALFIYTGRTLRPLPTNEAKPTETPPRTVDSSIRIEQTNPINSPNLVGNNNQVTIGKQFPPETSFCPQRDLVQSDTWDHSKLDCADVTIPWDDVGWTTVEAVADLTVLVLAPPETSPTAHLRIVDLKSKGAVAERTVREIRSSPAHVEYQNVKLQIPRASGTRSYRLEFRTDDKAALKVAGPIKFVDKSSQP
jgi:hypothetical protein